MGVAFNYDAKRVDDVVETLRKGLGNGEIPALMYGSEDVYQAELEKLYAKGWLIMGLECEIPNPGDYVLRYIGEDEVIVSRDESGQVNIMLNHCRHRGTAVCHDMKGNTSHFVCPYHGWTYKNDGKWIAAPKKNVSYQTIEKENWSMLKAQVEVRWGVIFASVNPEETLDEFLGDAKFFYELFFALDSRGLRLLGEPSNYIMKKNWKMGLENAVGDCYHIFFGHTSMVDIEMLPPVNALNDNYTTWHAKNSAAGIMCKELDSVPGFKPPHTKFSGYTPEVLELFDGKELTDAHWEFSHTYHPFILGHFPNAYIFRWYSPNPMTGEIATFYQLRLMQPHGPGETEVCNIMFNYAIEPEENCGLAYSGALLMMGAAGLLDMVDGANWEGTKDAGKSIFAKEQGFSLNYQMGMNGMGNPEQLAFNDYSFIGSRSTASDANLRNFHENWLKAMTKKVGETV